MSNSRRLALLAFPGIVKHFSAEYLASMTIAHFPNFRRKPLVNYCGRARVKKFMNFSLILGKALRGSDDMLLNALECGQIFGEINE